MASGEYWGGLGGLGTSRGSGEGSCLLASALFRRDVTEATKFPLQLAF